jgi:hypothetical protein
VRAAADAFWTWFGARADRLLRIERSPDPLLTELAAELGRVRPGLVYELGPHGEDPRSFVVSADGISTLFPEVLRLVAAAPELPGWSIRAFRPRRPGAVRVEIEGCSLGTGDVWFRAFPEGSRVRLQLFVRGLTDALFAERATAVFLLLDAALGERDAEEKLGSISWRPLPEDPERAGMRPFGELVRAVDVLAGPT